MKFFLRATAVFLILLSLIALSGCGEKASYAILVEDLEITENDYYRNTVLLRSNFLSVAGEEDTEAFWTEPSDDGTTVSQAFTDFINEYLINAKLYALQFDRLGLSFTESEESTIQNALSEAVEDAGSMSAFTEQIGTLNYTYEEYVTEVYDSAKKSKVLSYYFGEDSEDPVSLDDIKDYYNLHNALIKAVYITKLDGETGETLDEEGLAEAAQRAEDALAAATTPSETDTFDDVISIYSDTTLSQGDGIVISDNGNYDESISDAALALSVGEVAKIETDTAYLIIKRYDGTADDVFTATMQQTVLETLREEEITALLEEWRAETKIKINTDITDQYAPEKLIEEE